MSAPNTRPISAADSNAHFAAAFATTRVMAILRGFGPAETVELCTRAWSVGIEVVEVPIQAVEAVPSLEAAVSAGRTVGRAVGAGTVTTVQLAEVAARAGAAFTVAPGLDPEVATACLERGLPHLPGVATASEIQRAVRLGLIWLKAFPAEQLTPGWIAAQRAPFPTAEFVATGGIGLANADDFLTAGARVLAIGSALTDGDQLEQLGRLVAR
jgi:2-dehydro-3-deoxyphosphogluconate aldolase/(4S)-4-hydroxy-2-oxoglutarate aldolase